MICISVRRNTLWCVPTSLRPAPAHGVPAVSCSIVYKANETLSIPLPPHPRKPEPRNLLTGLIKQSTQFNLWWWKSSSSLTWLILTLIFFQPPGPVCLSSCLRTLRQLPGRPLWVPWNCLLSSLSPALQKKLTHPTHCQSKPPRLKVTIYIQTWSISECRECSQNSSSVKSVWC